MAKKSGLGKGLDALFEDNFSEIQDNVQNVRMSEIEPNKNQPRRHFDNDAITVLADSIQQHGLIQPILVRPYGSGYQIVAGERRWRACKMLGMIDVPVVIKELSDSETAQIAIIENIQRENLNPIEEAFAYKELMENYDMTQDQVAKTVGKSRPAVANALRLLNMPEQIQDMLKIGDLTSGQAKAIAALDTDEEMIDLAHKARNGMMTVRNIEKTVTAMKKDDEDEDEIKPSSEEKKAQNYITEMEISLHDALNRKIKISSKDGEKGTITIDFFDKDDLSILADKLTAY